MNRKTTDCYRTNAKVVSIDTTKKDLSGDNAYQNNAFVEFTDYKGNPAKGSFTLPNSPLYTTIRINSVVEIEYEEGIISRYTVRLLNPELYKRVPTQEELAPYKRNNRRVMCKGLLASFSTFVALVLWKLSGSPLIMIALCIEIYIIMKFHAKQEQEDRNQLLDWHEEKKK